MRARVSSADGAEIRNGSNKLRGFFAGSEGAAMIEFALVLPFLLLVFFGMIGWGYTLTVSDNMYYAARQAARELAVGTANEAQAKANAEAILAAWPATFSVVAQDTGTTGTQDVQVTITTTNVMAGLFSFIPIAPALSSSVVMRAE